MPSLLPAPPDVSPSSKLLLDEVVGNVNPHFIILALLPWLLFAINPNWMFQGFGHMDPWYYFGVSVDFPRYQHLFNSYANERLTWTLPARLFVAVLSPVYGWLLFHVGVYYVSLFSLYSIVRRLFDRQTAILTATMLGCHALFIGANGWTYVESGSIAYLLLTFTMLTSAREARRPLAYVVGAGIFWAAAAYTYPLWWALTPCCALYYWTLVSEDSLAASSLRGKLSRYGVSGGFFCIGLAITTFLMVVIHDWIHGSGDGYFFFQNIAEIKFHLAVKKEQINWGSDSYAWFSTAGWIVFPVLTAAVSTIVLVQALFRKTRLDRPKLAICLTYEYAFLMLLYLQLRNSHVLEFDYYVSILIPFEFMVLAALVFRVPQGASQRAFYWVLGSSAAISLMPLLRDVFYHPQWESSLTKHYVVGLAVIGIGVLGHRVRTWGIAVIGLAIVSFGLVPALPVSAWLSGFNGLAAMRRVGEAVQAIDANTPPDKIPSFWIDNFNDPNTREFRAIMCAFQAHFSSMWNYPNIDSKRRYPPGTELVLITSDKDIFDHANAAMTDAGMPLRMWKQQQIYGEGDVPLQHVSYWLTFTDVGVPPPDAVIPANEKLEVIPGALKLANILKGGTPEVLLEPGPPVRIVTAPQQWAYAAYAELPFTKQDGNVAEIRVSARILRGKVAFGVLDVAEKVFHTRVTLEPKPTVQEITLDVQHPGDSRKLIIQNETPGGQSGEAVISRIELLAYPSARITQRLQQKTKPVAAAGPQGH